MMVIINTLTKRKRFVKGTRPLPSVRSVTPCKNGGGGDNDYESAINARETRCRVRKHSTRSLFARYTPTNAIRRIHTHTRACTPLTWHIPGGNVCKCIHVIWSDGDAVSHSYSPTRARTNPPPHSLRASFQDRALQSVSATRPVGASSFVLPRNRIPVVALATAGQ